MDDVRTISLGEIRSRGDIINEYEVWDEEKQIWIDYRRSCYDVGDCEFPEPEFAKYPINLITYHDNFTDKFYVYSMQKVNVDERCVLQVFKTETALLTKFIEDLRNTGFDIITGYNCFQFDIPYIYNRTKRIISERDANHLSPYNRVREKKIRAKGLLDNVVGYALDGISILDYYLLYRQFVIPAEGEKSSYSLHNVCMEDIGEGKLEFDGNLKQLYKNDYQRFVDYNIKDVELVIKLDKKRNLIALTRTLCYMSLVPFDNIYSSSNLVNGNILQFSKTHNVKIPYVKDKTVSPEFAGAFVRVPRLAAHRDGVAIVDVQSLYPNIMIALNISPETYVGKACVDDVSSTVNIDVKGKTKNIKKDDWNKLMATGKYVVAPNGSIYSTAKEGLLPSFLSVSFEHRLKVKNKEKQIRKDIAKAKKTNASEEEIRKLETHADSLYLEQLSRKIILNTVYGVCASAYSPFYNVNNAEAITSTGQKIIISSSEFINKLMRERYGATTDAVLYNDTDSSFFDMKSVVDLKYGSELKSNLKDVIKDADKITAELNNWCRTTLSNEILPMYKKDRIKFVREVFCDVVYFFKSKRYILHIVEKDGEMVDEFEYTGISVTRSTYPAFMKNTIREIYEKSTRERWSDKHFLSYMDDLYDKFCKMSFNEISIHKSMSSYKEGLGFLMVAKGTPGHAKAALYYNQLLDHLKISNKYDKVLSGKIRVCYINPNNEFNIDVIGFNDKIPDEFLRYFKPNYDKMFELLFLQPIEDFCICNEWPIWQNFMRTEFNIDKL